MGWQTGSRGRGWGLAARSAVLALPLLASAGGRAPARAQEFHENLPHWCQDFWMLRRREILECLLRDYAAADAELNAVYRATMARLTAPQRAALRAAQRAWLRRYDVTLTAYYSRSWANHSRVKVLPSQIRALRDRTAHLRAYRP